MAFATSAALLSALEFISPNVTFVSFLLLATFALLCLSFYRVFFSPLAAIPGPWYAAISDFWLTTHVARLQQCTTVQSLFDKYGPVVRIGPNKIAFCDFTTMRSVYCINKFEKSTYYKSLLTSVVYLHFFCAIWSHLPDFSETTTITRTFPIT